ncbi:rod shape-determining protein MreD [Paracoccus sp. (in: a-proteobacteria)]|uniref:rod shape-determining protein MreD n=1 Tax=Paracoccus sp. TaxID=267 RepID=UPI0028A07528|nr:rod shape-determining protein MreD [Paracoccus sp. (in: a-proteobacteria)]
MIERVRHRRYVGMVLYALVMLVILLVRLLPLSPGSITWPGPDLMLAVTLVWVLRRPEQLPVLLIAAVFFIEDMLMMRPPGLWTALVIVATEAARHREHRWRELPFMVEWLRVALLIALIVLANRFTMAIFFVQLPSLGQVILQYIATVMSYPIVVALARWTLGLRRVDYIEAEIMRHR